MDRLKDKVAVITGAAAGIGAATARLFAEEGASLTLCDITMESLEKTVAEIKQAGGKAIPVKCNVADNTEVKALIAATVDTYGKIDILINNAGITRDGVAIRMTEENWDLVMDINLKGTFLCCKHAISKMKRGSKIVNTASISSLGNPGQANYAASKMGVIGLTKTLALEYARKQLCINAVAPGAVETPMLMDVSEKMRQNMIAKIPLGRPLPPVEIAKAHLFLASDDANFITGQTLFVDGGMSVGF
jgi:3-oxoacyl-[acyl-carrier protein] reductase